jgi:hypothetical protein
MTRQHSVCFAGKERIAPISLSSVFAAGFFEPISENSASDKFS